VQNAAGTRCGELCRIGSALSPDAFAFGCLMNPSRTLPGATSSGRVAPLGSGGVESSEKATGGAPSVDRTVRFKAAQQLRDSIRQPSLYIDQKLVDVALQALLSMHALRNMPLTIASTSTVPSRVYGATDSKKGLQIWKSTRNFLPGAESPIYRKPCEPDLPGLFQAILLCAQDRGHDTHRDLIRQCFACAGHSDQERLINHVADQIERSEHPNVLHALQKFDRLSRDRPAAEAEVTQMILKHDLSREERHGLITLLAWRELASMKHASSGEQNALFRQFKGDGEREHLARAVCKAFQLFAPGSDPNFPHSDLLVPTERHRTIAADCLLLQARHFGPEAFEGLVRKVEGDRPRRWTEEDDFEAAMTPRELSIVFMTADLRWADFRHKNLCARDLSHVCFAHANLSGCGTSEEMNFRSTNFQSADLTELFITKADFGSATLAKANLTEAHLGSVSFQNADLRGAIMRDASGSISFENADLSGVNFIGSNLKVKNAEGANFKDSLLPSPTSISNWNFSRANPDMTGAQVAPLSESDYKRLKDEHSRDGLLNHLENDNNGNISCLTAIDKIPDKRVRLHAMETLVAGLSKVAQEGISLSGNLASILDGIFRRRDYLENDVISNFAKTYLMPQTQRRLATGEELPRGLQPRGEIGNPDRFAALEYALEYMHQLLQATLRSRNAAQGAGESALTQQNEALCEIGPAVNRLLWAASHHSCEAKVVQDLRETWAASLPDRLHRALDRECLDPKQPENCYVELSGDGTRALAYEPQYMRLIEGRPKAGDLGDWKAAYRFEPTSAAEDAWHFAGGLATNNRKLEEDLQPYPWIRARYIAANIPEKRDGLVKTLLNLNTSENPAHAELLAFFEKTKDIHRLPNTDPEDRPWLKGDGQSKLVEIIAPLLQRPDASEQASNQGTLGSTVEPNLRFVPSHIAAVEKNMASLMDSIECGSPSLARAWLAQAMNLTHMSSSALMGSEGDSPAAVRCAVVARLNQAMALDPDLLSAPSDSEGLNIGQDWIARLCGSRLTSMTTFTCTSVLHHKMSDFVRNRRQDQLLADAVAAAVPPAWR
jgi:uncharacterized protein YjbI with pentapeptide repeats